MRNYSILASGAIAALLCTACKSPEEPPKSEFKMTSTMREIMGSMVMPSANFLWNAVSSTTTDKGVVEKTPKTEQEWSDVRDPKDAAKK